MKSAFLTVVFLDLVQQAITTCDKEDSCKVCVKKGCIFILTANGEECVSSVVGRKIKVRLNRLGQCSIAAGILFIIVNLSFRIKCSKNSILKPLSLCQEKQKLEWERKLMNHLQIVQVYIYK